MLTGLALAGLLVAATASAGDQLPEKRDGGTWGQPRSLPQGWTRVWVPDGKGSILPNTPVQLPNGKPRAPRSKVVCGTTLIIVDSTVDPEMVKPKPDQGRKFPIRRYPPPACGSER
jgi:hypothetical protein